MLAALFGNSTAEQVLLYLAINGDAYAQQLSATLGIPLSMVQKQMRRLEAGGILVSDVRGRTRIYSWNPRFPLRNDLRDLLLRAVSYLSDAERQRLQPRRRRPRLGGKP